MTITVFAPAKINLALHVTGRREDGYHLLDSLVSFAGVGDTVRLTMDTGAALNVDGPEAAGVPDGPENLVLRVAALFGPPQGIRFDLTKNLPAASGIGGGSADAAAAFRALLAQQHCDAVTADQVRAGASRMRHGLLTLGADIPVCVMSAAARFRGIGDQIDPIASLPALPAVLVNPRRAVSTLAVFRALTEPRNAPMPDVLPGFAAAAELVRWLAGQRNDLEPAAIRLEPVISEVKAALERTGACRLARMSGSGATCFGLFDDEAAARAAADRLRSTHPDWWVRDTLLQGQTGMALPKLGLS